MTGRLYRSRTDRVIGGVAGGVADYLNLDPSLVRIVWAVLAFVTGGLFFLIYIVMWIVVPEAPFGVRTSLRDVPPGEPAGADVPPTGEGEVNVTPPRARGDWDAGNTRLVFGLVLIGLGAYFLLRSYVPDIAWDRFWPVLLVLAGVALLIASMRRSR